MFLRENPFKVTPDEDSCKIWAGRRELYEKWKMMFDRGIRTKPSRLYLVWGDYGAGKTHALRHFRWLMEKEGSAFAVYTEFSTDSKKFIDLYRQFAEDIDFLNLQTKIKEVSEYLKARYRDKAFIQLQKLICQGWFDFAKAIEASGGSENLSLIREWLCGGRIYKRDLKQVGLIRNIENDFDAVKSLRCLVRLLTFNYPEIATYPVIVWMIDEMQAIEDLRSDYRNKIMRGIKQVYDGCSTNFCLILTYKVPFATDIVTYIPDALKQRLPLEYDLPMPKMDTEEAFNFVLDLLKHYRPYDEKVSDEYSPFTRESIMLAIDHIGRTRHEITPRDIMVHFQKLLDDALFQKIIENHKGKITTKFVRQVFQI